MLGALKVYARNNQACLTTPFILSGAMSPSPTVGTCTVTLAEALVGMADGAADQSGLARSSSAASPSSISMQYGAHRPSVRRSSPWCSYHHGQPWRGRLGVPFPAPRRRPLRLQGSRTPSAAYESANTMLPDLPCRG